MKGFNANGEGETKNYIQTLQSLQANILTPLIDRHNLISMRADFSDTREIRCKFNPIDMPTEKELAEVEAMKAQADVAYVTAGVLSAEEVRSKLAADPSNGYNSLSEELPADLTEEEIAYHDEPEEPEVEVNVGDEEPVTGDAEWDESKHARKDNGQFGKGSGKSSAKATQLTGKELGNYSDIKDLRQKAVEYYKKNLQGKTVENTELGKVSFSGKGLKKFVHTSAEEQKLQMVVALEDIIQRGKYKGVENPTHSRPDGIVKFHRLSHQVFIGKKGYLVSALVGEDANGNKFYNLNPHSEEYTKDEAPSLPTRQGQGSGASSNSIGENKGFVNLFVEDYEA